MLIEKEPQYYTCIVWRTFSKFMQTLKLNVSSLWSYQLPPKALTSNCITQILGCRQEQLWIARCVSLNVWVESIKWSCTWLQTTTSDYIKKQLVSPFQRHRATSRKVVGSIPDGAIAIFHWHNPSDRTMALGSTQSLTEMSTRNTS